MSPATAASNSLHPEPCVSRFRRRSPAFTRATHAQTKTSALHLPNALPWLWVWVRLGLTAFAVVCFNFVWLRYVDVCWASHRSQLAQDSANALAELAAAKDPHDYAELRAKAEHYNVRYVSTLDRPTYLYPAPADDASPYE